MWVGWRTEERIALLSVSKIFTPWALACDRPTIKLPIEQMDSRRRELLAEGRKVGAWMTGKSGWNCVK
jgi:hypothetical protein